MDRSVLALPPHLRRLLEDSSKPQPREPRRSTIRLPPNLQKLKQSCLSVQQQSEEGEYDILSLIQYLSDFPRDANFLDMGNILDAWMEIGGRGRTYEVRRYSEDTDWHNHWRDSRAFKFLRISVNDNESSNSFRYKSLIQEVRILRHPALSMHPNMVRVNGIAWHPHGDGLNIYLPALVTEYSALGTVDKVLSSWRIPYMNQKRRLILDVAEGLSALHSCSLVHGDVKSENVLVFLCEDPTYPFVAKLTDFGFSVDISNREDSHDHLIGYTPLWAAPEATERLKYSAMPSTDIYSSGFVIWAIAHDGQTLFDSLQHLPEDPHARVQAFNGLKKSDQLLTIVHQELFEEGNSGRVEIYSEILNFLHDTLQSTPSGRTLRNIINHLRQVCPRANEKTFLKELQTSPLSAFDHQKIDINPDVIVKYYQSRLGRTLQQRLEHVASMNPPPPPHIQHSSPDSTLPWRYPTRFRNRPAGAAFALFQFHFWAAEQSESLVLATPWLKLSANLGFPLAMAICAQLNEQWNIGLSQEQTLSWLRRAAEGGSRPAMKRLKEIDSKSYQEISSSWKQSFWRNCHGISDAALDDARHSIAYDPEGSLGLLGTTFGIYNDSLLHLAAMTGSLQLAQFCLNQAHIDVNGRNTRLETPLLLACKSGHTSIIDLLLGARADPTIADIHNQNCLHWLICVEEGSLFDYAWRFLERGVDLHQSSIKDVTLTDELARTWFHRAVEGTPLHWAVECGARRLVEVLLDLGANSLVVSDSFTPLCFAARNHFVDILRTITSYPLSADIDTHYQNKCGEAKFSILNRVIPSIQRIPLLFYIQEGYHYSRVCDTMCALMSAGAKVNKAPVNQFALALRRRSCYMVRFLLENRYEDVGQLPDSTVMRADLPPIPPIQVAVLVQDINMVNVLLANGADPNAVIPSPDSTMSPLSQCAKLHLNRFDIPKRLIEAGADVHFVLPQDKYNEQILSRALISNDFPYADFLLANGASTSYSPPNLFPSLSCIHSVITACGNGVYLYRALKYLVDHPSADIPFWTCKDLGLTIFYRLFRRSEAISRFWDFNETRAIFELVRGRFPGIAVLNMSDYTGGTPLHYAVHNANATGVQLLLDAGCSPNILAVPNHDELRKYFANWLTLKGLSFTADEFEEWYKDSAAESLPTFIGMSAVEIARQNMFVDIPTVVQDHAEELGKYVKRRRRIKDMLGVS